MVYVLHLRVVFAVFILLAVQQVTWTQNINTAFQRSFYAVLNSTNIGNNTSNNTSNDSIVIECSPAEKAYLSHYQLFLREMINNTFPTNYSEQLNSINDTLNKYSDGEVRTLAFLSEIYLQKGIMEYVADKQRDAILSFFKAYRYWQKSESEHPKLISNLKLTGIFNLLMSNMPQPYNRWAGWIGYGGDSERGFAALNAYLEANGKKIAYKQDAIIHLAFSYLKFDVSDKEIEKLILDSQASQLTPLAQFALTRCAFKIRKPSLATPWFADSTTQTFLPMLYLKGKYQVLSFDKKAEKTLLEYIKKNTSGQFVADAHRYLSWHYFLTDATDNYHQQQKIISKLKAYPTWEDKQANYENSLDNKLHKTLLQSRILFDAGKYKDAIDTLTVHQASIKGPAQNIELQYRLGRCYQMIDQKARAIFHYSEAIKMGDDDQRYFAPYAALFTAELYLEENPVTAKFYLDEAKRLNNGEHLTDITRRIDLLQQQFEQ